MPYCLILWVLGKYGKTEGFRRIENKLVETPTMAFARTSAVVIAMKKLIVRLRIFTISPILDAIKTKHCKTDMLEECRSFFITYKLQWP